MSFNPTICDFFPILYACQSFSVQQLFFLFLFFNIFNMIQRIAWRLPLRHSPYPTTWYGPLLRSRNHHFHFWIAGYIAITVLETTIATITTVKDQLVIGTRWPVKEYYNKQQTKQIDVFSNFRTTDLPSLSSPCWFSLFDVLPFSGNWPRHHLQIDNYTALFHSSLSFKYLKGKHCDVINKLSSNYGYDNGGEISTMKCCLNKT